MKKLTPTALWRFLAVILAFSLLTPSIGIVLAAEGEPFYLSENYAYGKTAKANNAYSQAPASSAVDEDNASWWRTNSTCPDDFIYLIVDLEEETEINLIKLIPYSMSKMAVVKIQYTDDPTPSASSYWEDIKTLPQKQLSEMLFIDFDPVVATGIRFYADLSSKGAGLYEFQAYYTNDADQAKEQLNRLSFKDFTQPESVDAEIVSVGENGELIYSAFDGNGSTLIDYSEVGYKRGEEPIPTVKTVKTLEAGSLSDHTALIQNAIDEVSALPIDQRGAILLKAGKYTVSDNLIISASGVVLRGEGQGENGTVIYDVRTQREAKTLQIKGNSGYTVVPNTQTTLTNDLLPMGTTVLTLSSVSAYSVGDNVRVVCSPNDLWIKTLGMDVLPGDHVTQWKASDYVMTYERRVTAVDTENSTITVNTGIPLTLDKTYYPSVTVDRITDSPDRVTECGVENIRFLSYYNGEKTDEDHGWTAVSLSNCRDCWVTDVTAKNYAYATVRVSGKAINVTVEGCSFLEPISTVAGGLRYSFCIDGGQFVLIQNCYSYDSRHDYVVQQRVAGPNVFLDCVAEESNSVSEPHHRWSTGTLYDNIYQIGVKQMGYFEVINRGNSGTGHGWAGANTVFWNCLSPATLVGKPQTEQNFAIGVYGIFEKTGKANYLSMYDSFVTPTISTPNYPKTRDFENSPMYGNGYIESPYNPVDPSSLYKAQLAYRLTGNATKSVKIGAPLLYYPASDSTLDSYYFTVSGVCDQNAEKVNIYVDGTKYAVNPGENGEYSLRLYLPNGYHSICVTQEADGIESNPNAERTVKIDCSDEFDPSKVTDPNGSTSVPGENVPDSDSGTFYIVLASSIAGAVAIGIGTLIFIKRSRKK